MNNFYNPYVYPSNNNNFMGYYVSDYSEVLSKPTPMTGEATVFVDLEKNMLWSKKQINGVPYIQAYNLSPIYKDATNTDNEILKRLEALELKIINNKSEVQNEKEVEKSGK